MCYIKSSLNLDNELSYNILFNSSTYNNLKMINNDEHFCLSVNYLDEVIKQLQNIHNNNKISNECIDLIHYLDLDYLLWNYQVNLDNSTNFKIQILNNIIKNIIYYINDEFKYDAINELLNYFHNSEYLINIDKYITLHKVAFYNQINILKWLGVNKQELIINNIKLPQNMLWYDDIIVKTDTIITTAIERNNIDILNWINNYCIQHNIIFPYKIEFLHLASYFGNIRVIEWIHTFCLENNIKFEYDYICILRAVMQNHYCVIKWFQTYCIENNIVFINFNTPCEMTHIINAAGWCESVDMLNWCLQVCNDNNVEFIYSNAIFNNNNVCSIQVLNWLKKYSEQKQTHIQHISFLTYRIAYYGNLKILNWLNDYLTSINSKISEVDIWNMIETVADYSLNTIAYDSIYTDMLDWLENYCTTHNYKFKFCMYYITPITLANFEVVKWYCKFCAKTGESLNCLEINIYDFIETDEPDDIENVNYKIIEYLVIGTNMLDWLKNYCIQNHVEFKYSIGSTELRKYPKWLAANKQIIDEHNEKLNINNNAL